MAELQSEFVGQVHVLEKQRPLQPVKMKLKKCDYKWWCGNRAAKFETKLNFHNFSPGGVLMAVLVSVVSLQWVL